MPTAARWHVEHPYQEPGVYVADTETTALVAKVYPSDAGADLDTEARARLIAAAPEMLAALSAWSEWMTNQRVPFEISSATRLALAKAKA